MRKKRRLQGDATIDGLHRLLVQERYDEMLAATTAAVEQFPSEPEVRLMHGTALFWSRPGEAARELANAVSLDKNNPWLVVRAANLLVALGERDAAESYLDHAESLRDDDGELVSEIAYLRHKLAQMHE